MEGAGNEICPICNEPLIYIEEKKRFWCYKCRVNPFWESELHDREAAVFMVCSACDSVLKYIPEKKDFWCWTCNEYPTFYEKRARTIPLGPDDDPYKRSEMVCFICGRFLRYIKTEDKYWCDSCRNYPNLYYRSRDGSKMELRSEKVSGIYSTMHHPDGLSAVPKYKMKGNELIPYLGGHPHYRIDGNYVYPNNFSPEGFSTFPVYMIRGNRIYTTIHHEKGPSLFPWYIIK